MMMMMMIIIIVIIIIINYYYLWLFLDYYGYDWTRESPKQGVPASKTLFAGTPDGSFAGIS